MSMLCLKHSEFFYRNGDERRGSHGRGAVLFGANFLLCLETPAQTRSAFLNSLPGEELDVPAWTNSLKNLVFVRDVHWVNDEREKIGCPLSFPWLFFLSFFFLVSQPQLQRVHVAGSMQDRKTGDTLFFFIFCLGKAQLSYSIPQFCCVKVCWGLWASTFCCGSWELTLSALYHIKGLVANIFSVQTVDWLLEFWWLYNKNISVLTQGPVSLFSLMRIYKEPYWLVVTFIPAVHELWTRRARPRSESNIQRHRLASSSSSHLLILSDVSKSEGEKKKSVVTAKGLGQCQTACISNHTTREKKCSIQYQWSFKKV